MIVGGQLRIRRKNQKSCIVPGAARNNHLQYPTMNKQYFAQKGIVIQDDKILLIHYSEAPFNAEKVKDKYGLPGGRVDFGEEPDAALVREVQEETEITCRPGTPIYVWNWEYESPHGSAQINAVARICFYESGEPKQDLTHEGETKIDRVVWAPAEEVLNLTIIYDELPALELFLTHYDFSNSTFTIPHS